MHTSQQRSKILHLFKNFVKLIRGLGTSVQSAEQSSTSVSAIEPIYQSNGASMNELFILRGAMEDIAASGSEKANIALVLAEQARKRDATLDSPCTAPCLISKSASDEILTLVQDVNGRISAAIRSNSKSWSTNTDSYIEEARVLVNKIAQALIKDRK